MKFCRFISYHIPIKMSSISNMQTITPIISSNLLQQYVLEPCQLPKSIQLPLLQEYIKQYMDPRLEFYKETQRSLYIEDEFSEWWTVKATNGVQIGKGNEATDVVTSEKEGIDAMCVIMNNKESNEKSLIQNFNTAGCDLDNLFKNKDDTVAVQLFMNDLKKKLLHVKEKYELIDLYILAFISLPDSVHISCFKYNLEKIDLVLSSGFTQRAQSILINGFIEEKYGNVKLYKAKKRIELRLKKSCIEENPFSVKLY